MVKVSILMPACNVEKYIEECMDSVVKQTLKDIEIICINDGSKDNTGRILDRFANQDSRVKIVHKPNSGYGHSMNVALDLAQGEYIGIVETDDFASPNMFEKLYEIAKENDADVVKSNYYRYVSKPEPQDTFFEVLKPCGLYNKVFLPKEQMDVMRIAPCIWSGLYRREMLIKHNIRFNETPGASYQDTSFAFKVWTSVERAYLVKEAYLHYRVDNENSSVKSAAKVFCICDEYNEIERYLEQYPEKKRNFEKMKNALKYESYRWNLQRLTFGFKYAFLIQMKKELFDAEQKGALSKEYFSEYNWKNVRSIIDDMDLYYSEECCKEFKTFKGAEELLMELQKKEWELTTIKKQYQDVQNSVSFKVGRLVTVIPRKIRDIVKSN